MKKVLALVVAAGVCLPGVLGAQDKKKPDPEAQFKRLDTNNDSKLTVEEFKGKRKGDKATKAEQQFKRRDKNSDGFLSLEEFKAGMKKKKDK